MSPEKIKFFFSHLFAPLYWAVFVLPVVLTGPRDPLTIPFPVFLLTAVIVAFIAERIAPFNPDWNKSKNDFIRDLIHAVVNQLALILFLTVLFYTFTNYDLVVWNIWPENWPFFLQIYLALFIADALMTLAHYASHRVEILWRFHSIHHSVKRVYGLNGLMKHPLHKIFEASCGFVPLYLLGMPLWLSFFTGYVAAIHFLLSHINVKMENRILSRWFALATVHRFHHLQKRRSAINYGIMFNFWDMLLGTFFRDPDASLKSEELGIKDYPHFPDHYPGQITIPIIGWKPLDK